MAKLAEWDAPLQALWRRRDELNKREWNELWQLTSRILRAYPFKEHDGLTLPLEDCINDFFVQKVYESTMRDGYTANARIHANALREYFRRFLIDLHRANPGKQNVSMEDAELQVNAVAFQQYQETPEPEWVADVADVEQIEAAAREFLQSQEPWVGWYLRYHYCPPCWDQDPIPLVRFADHVPSYHYKATRLGLAPAADGDFRRTLLGRWLRSLNIPEIFDDRDLVQAVLKILCQQSLLLIKDELPFTDAADPANDEKE